MTIMITITNRIMQIPFHRKWSQRQKGAVERLGTSRYGRLEAIERRGCLGGVVVVAMVCVAIVIIIAIAIATIIITTIAITTITTITHHPLMTVRTVRTEDEETV